jgi:1-acyl-sn-glycerol-3-phosphate acyltransferase
MALELASPEASQQLGPVDDFGFDRQYTERILPLASWLYRRYWRVETDGVDNVPATGRALLVANHSGVVPYDGAMIRTAIWLEHPQPRHARMLVVNWAFAPPLASTFLTRTGNVLAHPDNARELLLRDELVGVFPEGVKGASKRFSERYKVGRFGRGGFVQIALRTGAPIVPVAVVGGEEVHPVVFEAAPLARLFGLPIFPITPTFPWLGPLGLLPLPSKWLIAFGEPIDTREFGPDAADEPSTVLELSERVRSWIQVGVDKLLARRATAFF